MSGGTLVGSLARLWIFPVKSMLGEAVGEGEVTANGLVGDRGYALIDSETGKVVSAKSTRLYPNIFGCRASFLEAPRVGAELPPVRIDLPDGKAVESDSPKVDAVLSDYLGRGVTLAREAPEDFTIDMYHPDVEDADPEGLRDTTVEQKVGSAYWDEAGAASPVPVGSFLDLFPVTVLTTSTLRRMNALAPDSRFDERRFRMNLIVESPGEGFVENDWVGKELAVGESLKLSVDLPDPRCVMTTLAQDDLPRDTDILRALVKHNRIDVGGGGLYPCAGVYAVVREGGRVRAGDAVSLL